VDDFEISSEGPGDCRLRLTDGAGTAVPQGNYSIVSATGTAVCTDKACSAGALAETLPPGTYLVTAKRQGGAAAAGLRLHVAAPLAVAA